LLHQADDALRGPVDVPAVARLGLLDGAPGILVALSIGQRRPRADRQREAEDDCEASRRRSGAEAYADSGDFHQTAAFLSRRMRQKKTSHSIAPPSDKRAYSALCKGAFGSPGAM